MRLTLLLPVGTAAAALLLVIITFAVIQSSPREMWDPRKWGLPKENMSWCEPFQESAVREPFNSWSNLAYSMTASFALGTGVMDLLRPSADVGTLPAHPCFSFLLFCSAGGLGISSFIYHASGIAVWGYWDMFFTFATASWLAVWSITSLVVRAWPLSLPLSPNASVLVLGLGLAALVNAATATTLALRDAPAYFIVGAFIGIAMICTMVAMPLLCGIRRRHWQWSTAAVVAVTVGTTFKMLEEREDWNQPLCLYSDWFQPHSVWHVSTALAIFCCNAGFRHPFDPPTRGPCCRRRPDASNDAAVHDTPWQTVVLAGGKGSSPDAANPIAQLVDLDAADAIRSLEA